MVFHPLGKVGVVEPEHAEHRSRHTVANVAGRATRSIGK